jgi:dCTP deaminase
VYAGMPIGQLIYFETSGEVSIPYGKKPDAKYIARSSRPIESMMFKNWDEERGKWK